MKTGEVSGGCGGSERVAALFYRVEERRVVEVCRGDRKGGRFDLQRRQGRQSGLLDRLIGRTGIAGDMDEGVCVFGI